MKKMNKFCLRAVAGAAALFVGMAPMPVFANAPKCICEERCTEDHINEECPVCSKDYTESSLRWVISQMRGKSGSRQ